MSTRTRLLVAFLGAHVVLSALAGVVAGSLASARLQAQAEDTARRLGEVLAGGGFSLNDAVLERMAALTGYRLERVADSGPAPPGMVQVGSGARAVRVAWDNDAHADSRRLVLVATVVLVCAGGLAFALVAQFLAGRIARPLERLAGAARAIGRGDWQAPVPVVGHGEIRLLAADLEAMRRRLDELDRAHRQAERLAAVGTFTTTIAHEIRNPLSAVRLALQLQQRKAGGDPGLATALQEIDLLDDLLDQLLGFSRGLSARPEPCRLEEVALAVAQLLDRQARHAGVTIAVSGSALVSADPRRMRQLLLNLVLNAIQVQHGGGAVRVLVDADGLVVEDDGPGVAEERIKDLFEPFASDRDGGSGLGLHLAQTVAAAHGASLTYEPAPTGGARFRLSGLAPLR